MNLLLVREFSPDAKLPDFGGSFFLHMEAKTNPAVHQASLNAWALLAEGLERLGLPLYTVEFTENGKPFFPASPLHFSLSHSGGFAAAMIADSPCGVDIEQIREVKENLIQRCMHPEELAAGMDFFEVWTKKECIAKLEGSGMRSRPNEINSLEHAAWLTQRLGDSTGRQYYLSAVSAAGEQIKCSF